MHTLQLNEEVLGKVLDDAQELNSNLIEFYLLDNKDFTSSDNVQVYQTGVSKDKFYSFMNTIQRRYSKYQVQQYKCNILGDIFYMNSDNKDITVSSKRTTYVDKVSQNVLCVCSNKKKLNVLSFPSTQVFDSEDIVKLITFKLTNRLSLCLIHSKSLDLDNATVSYEIKLSYSHDSNVDKDAITKHIIKIVKEMEQASIY